MPLRSSLKLSVAGIAVPLMVVAVAAGWAPSARANDPMAYPVVSRMDLTEPFHTRGEWELVVTQEPDQEQHGDIHVCFVHDGESTCPANLIPPCDTIEARPRCPTDRASDGGFEHYNYFGSVKIFDRKQSSAGPLLVVYIGGNWNGPGFPFGPSVWRYSRERNAFLESLAVTRSANSNGEARFVEEGPLAGSVIASQATYRRPYPYEIRVYRLQRTGHYRDALTYKGATRYNDRNPIAVIDSEMPETLRRLGLWRRGDPLPIPARGACKALVLRKGEEWCD